MDKILIYRIISFGLATGYLLEQLFGIGHSLYKGDLGEGFGWQFRYLTIWALIAHVYVGYRLLMVSCGRIDRVNDGIAAAAAALGLYVIIMYWGLFFIDPKLINGDHKPFWLREYYLHLVGPAILWFDIVFIRHALTNIRRVVSFNIFICIAYCIWIEFVIRPLNLEPIGSMTNGLPYPFLNDMSFLWRLIFYLFSIVVGIFPMLLSRYLSMIFLKNRGPKSGFNTL